MKRIEYSEQTFLMKGIVAELDRLGKNGWVLCSPMTEAWSNGFITVPPHIPQYTALFYREVEDQNNCDGCGNYVENQLTGKTECCFKRGYCRRNLPDNYNGGVNDLPA